MEATGWVAIYAAAVATGSLGWQIYNARQARRPQVTVIFDTWRTHQGAGRPSLEEATMRIRNRGEYTVQVDKVELRYPRMLFGPRVPVVIDGGGVPFDVPAREVVTLTIRPEKEFRFPRAAQGREFFPGASVVLRTGEEYKSWRWKLL